MGRGVKSTEVLLGRPWSGGFCFHVKAEVSYLSWSRHPVEDPDGTSAQLIDEAVGVARRIPRLKADLVEAESAEVIAVREGCAHPRPSRHP